MLHHFGVTSGFEGLAYPQFVPSPGQYVQAVSERLDYEVDWSEWLARGDAVVASSWSGSDGLTLDEESFTPLSATVWVSGGQPDFLYEVVNTVATVAGRVGARKLVFRIKNP